MRQKLDWQNRALEYLQEERVRLYSRLAACQSGERRVLEKRGQHWVNVTEASVKRIQKRLYQVARMIGDAKSDELHREHRTRHRDSS